MIIDCAVYRGGERLELPRRLDSARAAMADGAADPDDFVWLGLFEPTAAELEDVARQLHLPPLAVEDALNAHQRPKLEQYGDDLFVVLKTLWYVDAEDAVETGEISCFVGRRHLVTVRHGEGGGLSVPRQELERDAARLGHGTFAALHAICDRVVDSYEQVATGLEGDVDEVERSVFSAERTSDAQRIYLLKREMVEFRRAAVPLRDPMLLLSRGGVAGVTERTATYFRDIYDNLLRVNDRVEALDNLLSSALSAHLTRLGVQQNEDMRRISAWVAIVAVPTMIAGIYGMNFEHMPELHWTFGYPLVLAVMLSACTGLYLLFRRSGWL